FPFALDYVAVVQRIGAIENKMDWDVLVGELKAGDYPTGWQQPDPHMDAFLENVRFQLDESTVLWEDAVVLIMEGQVEQVVQLHNLDVTLTLRDGSTLKTVEPQIDEVFDVIKRCGDSCSDMILATE
ncbi:MAG: hypothetical protein P1S60_05985, partial [Anaerolineae bacterium]|nr:hypothetical protein [Anaerolineae bacterium]